MRRLPLAPLLAGLVSLVSVALVAPLALPAEPAATSKSIGSLFFIAKSENRNEVHYGVTLDAACAPVGAAPVFAYWRMRERGPLATEPLLSREVPVYGIVDPQRVERTERGGRTVLRLRALPNRPIAVDAAAEGKGCTATARAMIGGVAADLTSVFVQLRWPFGIDGIVMSGRADGDGHAVRERLEAP
jgi:hypothetical protein